MSVHTKVVRAPLRASLPLPTSTVAKERKKGKGMLGSCGLEEKKDEKVEESTNRR